MTTRKNGKSKKRGFITYKSYLFRDRDPILEAVLVAQSGSRMTFKQIWEKGGPTVPTLRRWNSGLTRRPQFCTVAAATRSLGKRGIAFNRNGEPYLVD